VSTRPTEKGLATITAFSELFGLHYLDRKPIRDFLYGKDRSLFLKLFDAERNGLISITINPPESRRAPVQNTETEPLARTVHLFLDEKRFFHFLVPSIDTQRDRYPDSRRRWDELRIEVLKIMLEKHLFPALLDEMKRELLKASREAALEEISSSFAAKLQVGPYQAPVDNTREYYKALLLNTPKPTRFRTAVGIYQASSEREPMYLCLVDSDGLLRMHTVVPDVLSLPKKHEAIKKFIVEHEPQLVVLNSSAGSLSLQLLNSLEKTLLAEIQEQVREKRRMKMAGQSRDSDDEEDEEEEDRFRPYSPSVRPCPPSFPLSLTRV
jgi:hypothetical protein